MIKEYTCETAELFVELETSSQGLTSEKAEKRLAEHGPNKLKEAPKPSLIRRFFEQLKDPMLIILIAAAVVSAVTSILQG